ncbi:recombinase family protein [Streptococcus equinus]|uniref:recombinase family protein n=1 Tax=Streptococcus equinus TaxID=1335 RepID=UPI003BF7A9D3
MALSFFYFNKSRIAVPTVYRRTGQLYRSEGDRTEWRNSTILRLIQSPVYQGHLVQRKTNKTLTETDYIRFEYYITREEYDKIVPERT